MSKGSLTETEYARQRGAFRLSLSSSEQPVCLIVNVDGADVDIVVRDLAAGGARLDCTRVFDKFYEGQLIGPAVLFLHDDGMPVVYPVVKWKRWPLMGVQFMEIDNQARETIYRFLFKLERKIQQQQTDNDSV
ncbi:MAG TPA: PilZ domain-containing protein [Terriglobia bacterium]|nr:PilZ domain-containing protein [Terriglobia bacterium]